MFEVVSRGFVCRADQKVRIMEDRAYWGGKR